MPEVPNSKDRIFAKALEEPYDQRAAFLDGVCGDNHTIRAEIEELLACHDAAGSFLGNPPEDVCQSTISQTISEGPGTVIGRYKLLQEIGEGGFGVVFMAEQQMPVRRNVAIKIVKPGMDTKAVIARFEAERQALALMNHPNIAKVHDAGTTKNGRPYFVMELVKGVPITKFCDDNCLSTINRLELFVTVCRAVQHAHQKGVIHRDLKPSNVMISLHDGKPVPVIIDFGVSKALSQKLTERTLFTAYGQMIGTPLYMSPEQAEMSRFDIDTRSDIYSLGVLLYELLTGSTPLDAARLRGTSYVEMQRLIREEDAPTPSTRLSKFGDELATVARQRSTDPKRLRQSLHGDLDWIVVKALEKERDRRYATANDFANDIERFLRDEAIEARPPSIGYKLRKFARRHKSAVTAGCAVAAAVLLGIIGTTAGMIRAERARIQAEENSEQLERQNYRQQVRLAQGELQAGRPVAALRLLNRCPTRYRNWEWRYLYRLAHTDRLEPVQVEMPRRVLSVDFSPVNPDLAAVATDDGTVILLTLRDKPESRLLVEGDGRPSAVWNDVPPSSLRFSPSGKQIAMAHGTNPVRLRDVTSGSEICELTGHGAVLDVAFHPDTNKRRLATASNDATVCYWNSDGSRLPGELAHQLWLSCIAYSPDGRLIATGSFDKSVVVWDADTNHRLHTLRLHTSPVTCLAFSHDSRLLATGSIDQSGIVWNVETSVEVTQLLGHHDKITAIAFNSDDSRIATASTDQTVKLWEVDTGEAMLTLQQEDGNFSDLAFSKDGTRLIAASRTKKLTMWDARPSAAKNEPLVLSGHTGRIWDVTFTRNGLVVSASEDGTVRVWDPSTAEELQRFLGHANVVFDVALHSDGERAASVGPFASNLRRHGVIIWELASGDVVGQRGIEKQTGLENREFHCVDVSPDGQWLLTAGVNVVRVWDLNRPLVDQQGVKIGLHDGVVWSARFSPCGRYLATAGSEGTVKLWDAQQLDTPQNARAFGIGDGQVTRLAFSPSGDRLACGDSDGNIIMMDTRSAPAEAPSLSNWNAHSHRVRCVAFSPDGEYLASGGVDETVKIWHVKTRRLIRNLLADGTVYSLAFSPDGQWLAAGDHSKAIRVWDVSFLADQQGLALNAH